MSNALALPGPAMEVLARMETTVEGIAERIDVLPLETPEQEAHAVKICSAIKRLISEGETARKEAVDPYKTKAKAIDAAFRGPRRDLEALEAKIKARLAEAAKARRLAAEAATRKAFTAMREGDAAAANDALAKTPEPVKHTGTIERWSWEVASYDMAKVPGKYQTLDRAAVAVYLKNLPDGAEPSIPGVQFERKVTIGVRK